MRKRPIAILFRLNEQEHQHLKEQAALSGHSTEQYIRSLIADAEIKPRPPGELAGQLLRAGLHRRRLLPAGRTAGGAGPAAPRRASSRRR